MACLWKIFIIQEICGRGTALLCFCVGGGVLGNINMKVEGILFKHFKLERRESNDGEFASIIC